MGDLGKLDIPAPAFFAPADLETTTLGNDEQPSNTRSHPRRDRQAELLSNSAKIRDDLVMSQVCMNSMRNNCEARNQLRFADFHSRIPNDARRRARVLWKSRCRPRNKQTNGEAVADKATDWRSSPSLVWPHDSLRDVSW